MDEHDESELCTERWCAGLRCTGTEPLDVTERAFLDGTTHRLARQFWTLAPIVPLAAGAPFALLVAMPRSLGPPWLDALCGFTLLGAAAVLPTWFAMRAHIAWRGRRRCLADLAAGEVLVFEGALQADDVLDDEQRQLLTDGLLVPKPGAPQRLRVLAHAQAALHRARRGPALAPVTIHEVAAGPAYAMRVTVPREVAFIDGAPDVRFLRRTLNDSERAELEWHVRRLRRPGVMGALWAFASAAWLAAALLRPGPALRGPHGSWVLVALSVVLATFTLGYLRALKLARGLERDTHTGWAFTLVKDATPDGDEDAAVAPDTGDDAGAPHAVEFLPHSRALWSERGRPARWRNLRRAA